jgi:alpha,alpha-trehalase
MTCPKIVTFFKCLRALHNVRTFRGFEAIGFLCCILSLPVFGQVDSQSNFAQHSTPIASYISNTWDLLTRSTADCRAYKDVKVGRSRVLYIPFDYPEDAQMKEVEGRCSVEIRRLPKRIDRIGDVSVAEVSDNGLLYLPHPYVVPGGRFNEMYGWDSYFIELGLLQSGRADLLRGVLDDFIFEVDHYGGVLNANRTYYLSRSQPPFLAAMISTFYRSRTQSEKLSLKKSGWLSHAYRAAARNYQLWITPPHQAGRTGLARYYDFETGPVPEMADDDHYYVGVIHWFLEHPNDAPDFLMTEPEGSNSPYASCQTAGSPVCQHLHVGTTWLSPEFFLGDRADRESGFDTTFRFGPFSGATHHFAPVCLNSLLYEYESEMARLATELNRLPERSTWSRRASKRKKAMVRFLWDPKAGLFQDYDFQRQVRSSYVYATLFYPLWAGLATRSQASQIERHLADLEERFGLPMSTQESGLQWDFPYGWAPCNWIAVAGFQRYGYTTDAYRLSSHFTELIEKNYQIEGTIREKYNVVSGSSSVIVSNGYAANVEGFGWTNGVYLAMKELLLENNF